MQKYNKIDINYLNFFNLTLQLFKNVIFDIRFSTAFINFK